MLYKNILKSPSKSVAVASSSIIVEIKSVTIVMSSLRSFGFWNNSAVKDGKGTFSKEAKKALKKNYISGKVNIAGLTNVYANTDEANETKAAKIKRVAEQFTDITLESPKKLIDNKLIFECKLNAAKSDKNIILQTLDLAEELSK